MESFSRLSNILYVRYIVFGAPPFTRCTGNYIPRGDFEFDFGFQMRRDLCVSSIVFRDFCSLPSDY